MLELEFERYFFAIIIRIFAPTQLLVILSGMTTLLNPKTRNGVSAILVLTAETLIINNPYAPKDSNGMTMIDYYKWISFIFLFSAVGYNCASGWRFNKWCSLLKDHDFESSVELENFCERFIPHACDESDESIDSRNKKKKKRVFLLTEHSFTRVILDRDFVFRSCYFGGYFGWNVIF